MSQQERLSIGEVVRLATEKIIKGIESLEARARWVHVNASDLGPTAACVELLRILDTLLQLEYDAVLLVTMYAQRLAERVAARKLLINADKDVINVYVERGWATREQAQVALEALDVEESRLDARYQDYITQLDDIYQNIEARLSQALDTVRGFYSGLGCQGVLG